ncbi:hypothetical protein [Haemophilus influenzae]|uniref:Uncharacterized protein n=1 Tax=Haemophilus influenzae TaxID=727 RepID=A0AAQ0RFW7_HAEIF|nr:hypothetical protein [Haemophilus influenzae]RFN96334.1 hypothetical protein CH638_03745 [Haemophilus influenzae]SQG35481.1 Uncharacterised protein [Haemophilus influenzae]VTX58760.1 Uncharacterised protein [Haemophilus influenzae]
MKYRQSLILCITVIQGIDVVANTRDPHEGGICHVETEYYYPGVWERYGENELICNYWKFLSEDEKQALESELNDYHSNETDDKVDEVDNSDYDTLDEMEGK